MKPKSHTLLLPYNGQKREHLVRSLKKVLHRTLPGSKLGTKFNNIKDLVNKSHQHKIVYYVACIEPGCAEDYTGETARKLNKRVIDHNRRE